MNILESERLCFRLAAPKDEDALYEIWGDAETMRYCGGAVRTERISKIIEYDRCEYEMHGNAVFALFQKADGRLIGICGGKLDEGDPSRVEVIIHLGKQAWGKGFATESVKAYLKWLKDNNKASLVYASAHPDNTASISMMKKCGFIQKGTRQYEDTGFVDEPYFEIDIGKK